MTDALTTPPKPDTKAHPVKMALDPLDAIARWPRATPLVALWADPAGTPWSRWSILAQPTGQAETVTKAFNGSAWRKHPTASLLQSENKRKNNHESMASPPDCPPFLGGWIGYLGYELGRQIEPKAQSQNPMGRTHPHQSPWADGVLLRCDSGWACDTWTGRWWRFGTPPDIASVPASQSASFDMGAMVSEMGRKAYCERVAQIVQYIRAGDIFQANLIHQLVAPFTGSARDLFTTLAASARPYHGAYLELPSSSSPSTPRRAIVSMSPELFLDFDPATRRVVTRPMKGTSSARLDPALLKSSTKDQAELNMIVDLMRNDLGRVCELGSVEVEEARVIEQHGGETPREECEMERGEHKSQATGGVHQGVATISGRLRDGLTLADLLLATFSPGSVTGAPKIRAMQIIEELEPTPRGPYCGAIGCISDSGNAKFNVAIRTATITENAQDATGDLPSEPPVARPPVRVRTAGTLVDKPPVTPSEPGRPRPDPHNTHTQPHTFTQTFTHSFTNATLSFGVGAGIVADSIPEKEWDETITKAGILGSVAASIQTT